MRSGTLIGPIIIAIGLILAALTFTVVGTLLQTADGSTELRIERSEAQIDRLRSEIEALSSELGEAREDIRRLTEDMALRPAAPPGGGGASSPSFAPGAAALGAGTVIGEDGQIIGMETVDEGAEGVPQTEAMTEVLNLADDRFNIGVSQPRSRIMLEILGHPRSARDYSVNCTSVTNPRMRAALETRQVGPIRVTMLKPALDSLERIMAKLEETEPEIYAEVGTAGALCVRLIRGSTRAVSNHSWGTAIDLKLEGKLDGFGDGGTQFGLLLLAELFNEEGWYWGATYSREDSMHFEVGVETLRKWREEGQI